MLLYRFVTVAALAFDLTVPHRALADTQTVVVWSYGFSPQELHLVADEPVTLVFVNRSGSSHDFTAQRFFQMAMIQTGAAPNGAIDLGPRETKSITLVPRRGVYGAHCSHFFHKQMGMTERILVD